MPAAAAAAAASTHGLRLKTANSFINGPRAEKWDHAPR